MLYLIYGCKVTSFATYNYYPLDGRNYLIQRFGAFSWRFNNYILSLHAKSR